MRLFNILLALLTLFATGLHTDIQAHDHPFQGGEEISYKLRYKWGMINADIARLDFNIQNETFDGEPCFRLVTRGATSNLAASLVKVKYYYDSHFRRSDLTPVAFYRRQTEGSYWAKNDYTWDKTGRRLHAIVDKSTRPLRDTVFTSAEVIHDVISAIYSIRAADLDAIKRGKTLHLVAALDCNMYDMFIDYERSENKKVPDMGTFATDLFVMRVQTRDGAEQLSKESAIALSNKGGGSLAPISMWITQDENRAVVFFSTAIAFGSINGRLTNASGTRCPLKPVTK